MLAIYLLLTFFLGFMFVDPVSAQEGLRDVKAPVAYPSSLVVVLLSVAVLAALILLGLFIKHRLRQSRVKRVIVLKPWEKALKQLTDLEKENVLAKEQYDAFYSTLSDILRRYVEEQFGIRAPDMTTEEFMQYLRKSSELNPAQKKSLEQFMQASDLVKFAKYQPDPSEAMQAFRLAGAFIEETRPHEEQVG